MTRKLLESKGVAEGGGWSLGNDVAVLTMLGTLSRHAAEVQAATTML